MKAASIAPLYCALYPAVAEICRRHGYALAIHGSMSRDFDLICVPWAEQVSPPEVVVKDIATAFAVGEPTNKNHGRLSYAVSVSFGECFFDMSFLPGVNALAVANAYIASLTKAGNSLVDEVRDVLAGIPGATCEGDGPEHIITSLAVAVSSLVGINKDMMAEHDSTNAKLEVCERARDALNVQVLLLKEKLQCEYVRPLTPEERSAWAQLREAAEDIDSLFRINVAPHYNALALLGDTLRAIKAAEKGAAS